VAYLLFMVLGRTCCGRTDAMSSSWRSWVYSSRFWLPPMPYYHFMRASVLIYGSFVFVQRTYGACSMVPLAGWVYSGLCFLMLLIHHGRLVGCMRERGVKNAYVHGD